MDMWECGIFGVPRGWYCILTMGFACAFSGHLIAATEYSWCSGLLACWARLLVRLLARTSHAFFWSFVEFLARVWVHYYCRYGKAYETCGLVSPKQPGSKEPKGCSSDIRFLGAG
ncbi:hypothetical protein J3F84DRAFT_369096 [Trichoderma pleuroticola]